METLEQRNLMAVLAVTTKLDVFDPGDTLTSLREAIETANISPGVDEIVFQLDDFEAAVIELELGELELTESVTITGRGAGSVTIDARSRSRIFNITAASGDFTIRSLTLRNGLLDESTGCEIAVEEPTACDGGAIRSATSDTLTVRSAVVEGNATIGKGGGIYAVGRLVLDSSTVTANRSGDFGGGAGGGVFGETEIRVEQSTISNNISSGFGGGAAVPSFDGTLTISLSTIVNNLARRYSRCFILDQGGGIIGTGLSITNSIVAQNETAILSQFDSGVVEREDFDVTTLIASDIIDRSPENDGVIRNNLIGYNIGYDHTAGTTGCIGFSIEIPEAPLGSPDANGNLVGGPDNGEIDPRLGVLVDNSGDGIPTYALMADSPAIDAGDRRARVGVRGIPPHDQRGEPFPRIVGGRIDIGAVERGIPGDADGNGRVDFGDFLILASNFGSGHGWHEGNFDGSSDGVQFADFLVLASNFGQAGEDVLERSILHDGLLRTFRVHFPDSYNGENELPVILGLHGSAQGITGPADADALDNLSGLTARANEEGYIVAFPYGKDGWNVGNCSPTWRVCNEERDDVGFIAAVIEDLDNRYSIDSEHVFAVGVSGGGLLAHRLGCELSDKINAFASVAGSITPDVDNACSPLRPVSVLDFQGTSDSVPYAGGTVLGIVVRSATDRIARWGERNGANSDPMESLQTEEVLCLTYAAEQGNSEATLCTIEGGGHNWPGGPEFPGSGRVTEDIDATDMIFEFFAEQEALSLTI